MELQRDYYPLTEAAHIIGIAESDVIHFGAIGKMQVHILMPVHVRVNPLWCKPDDIFGEQPIGERSGLPVHEPAFLNPINWKGYEADPGHATVSHLEVGNFPDSSFQNPGILRGWEILNEDWDPIAVRIADCSIVVMVDEIKRFAKLSRATPDEKPLSTTERNTLLTIIAALCDYSAIKTDDRGAATQIANLTAEIGASVSDDTVRRWLKMIPDALASRMK